MAGTYQGRNDPLRGRVHQRFFIFSRCYRCGLPLSDEGNACEESTDPRTGETLFRPVHWACAQLRLPFSDREGPASR